MRIGMLTYSTKPRGGVVHALNLSEALMDLGEDIRLFSLRKEGEREFSTGFYRKTRVPYDIFEYTSTGDIERDVEHMIDTYKKNLPLDYEIYHSQDCVGANALSELRRLGNLNAPTVRTVHHVDEFRGEALTELQEKSIHLSDEKIVVSRYWQRILRREYNERSHLVYNGVDLDKYACAGAKRKSSVPSILYVGGLEARKGVEFLLLAMEQVRKEIPNSMLTIIGRSGLASGQFSDERKLLRDLTRRLGIEENVHFQDFVPEKSLPRYYHECDVFVLPSRMEGWGLTLMEAMASSKPVIAHRVGGIPELVDHCKNGLLLECGDVRGLAESIIRILTDRKLARSLGKAAREKVEQFSWERSARMTLRIYETALKKES